MVAEDIIDRYDRAVKNKVDIVDMDTMETVGYYLKKYPRKELIEIDKDMLEYKISHRIGKAARNFIIMEVINRRT